jgi:hypothetical protein
MFKEHQLKRLNSSSLSPTSDHRLDMLPSTTTTKIPLISIQRLTRMPSNINIERCCFLLIHLLFYIIILTIIYIRLDQFTKTQDKMLFALRANDNFILHKDSQRRLPNYNQ